MKDGVNNMGNITSIFHAGNAHFHTGYASTSNDAWKHWKNGIKKGRGTGIYKKEGFSGKINGFRTSDKELDWYLSL